MTTETQEQCGMFVATEVYPIKWRLDAAIEELSAGNSERVRYYLAEMQRELNDSMLHMQPMPGTPPDVWEREYHENIRECYCAYRPPLIIQYLPDNR